MIPKEDRSDGYYHNRISWVMSIPLFVVLLVVNYEPERIDLWLIKPFLAMFGCGIVGMVMSPDLDLEGWSISKSNWRKFPIIGTVMQYVWHLLWLPYAKMNPHRGRSHTILGSIDRLLYLAPLWIWIYHLMDAPILFFIEIIGHLWLGIFVSDMGHIYRDGTGFKI